MSKKLQSEGYEVLSPSREELDLLNREQTFDILGKIKPDLVIDAAAKVGGIGVNNSDPLSFLSENLRIQTNLMDASVNFKIKKFVFLGSSCIYPRLAKQPIREEYLMTGQLESTNSAYAVAKIAGIEACNSARRQLNLNWFSMMPTNVYGPRDNFNLSNSHVIPGMIRKFMDAIENNLSTVELWGNGEPLREFIFVEDLCEAVLFAISVSHEHDILNVGTGYEISIKELAMLISKETGFNGEIKWNTEKPNGTPRKLLDSSRIRELGWSPKINLELGIRTTIEWFRENQQNGLVRK